jgi:hypothetical protein
MQKYKSIDNNVNENSIENEIEDLKRHFYHIQFAMRKCLNPRLKTQMLTLIPEYYSNASLMQFFEITKYQIDKARKQSKEAGVGELMGKGKRFRNKLTKASISIFLNFITSDDYMHDVANGDKIMKFENGDEFVIPNTVRLACNIKIIRDYFLMCERESIKPLSQSTCYKLLNKCPASYRKSMQGLDNVVCDGLNAFDGIEVIINNLKSNGLDDEKVKIFRTILNEYKNYLKFSFKKKQRYDSECSDHCVKFALSSKNLCTHKHKSICPDCNSFNLISGEILKEIENFSSDDQKKELNYSFNLYKEEILEWKYHLIRNYVQDKIKYKILNDLKPGEVYIHMDWAMKLEPQKYREKQSDWFAKRGINWHITSVVFNNSGNLSCLRFAHLFDSVSQDCDAVIGILDSVFKYVKQILGKKKIYLRSDNAGCYHNQVLICVVDLLATKYEHSLKRYDFCEPQTGKDVCDRIISPIKRAILEYVDNGGDVTNAVQMKQAIDSADGLNGLIVLVCEMNDSLSFQKAFSIKNITKYFSFEYENENINLYNYYDIGEGEKKTIESFASCFKSIKELIITSELTIIDKSDDAEGSLIINKNKDTILKCEIEGCSYVSFSESKLEQHIINHENITNTSQMSNSMKIYAELLTQTRSKNTLINENYLNENCEELNVNSDSLSNGFALKKRKTVRFNNNQIDFLKEQFNIGVSSGRNVTAIAAEKKMIQFKDRFSFEERLNAKQIKSYFSKLSRALEDEKTGKKKKEKIPKASKKTKGKKKEESSSEDEFSEDYENDEEYESKYEAMLDDMLED